MVPRGTALPELGSEGRHELRIALKNLRYGAEFFAGVLEHPKKARPFAKAISALQDFLGTHNDVVTARRLIDGLGMEPNSDESCAACFVLGWFARGVPSAEGELHRTWRTFKRARRGWE